LDPLTATCCTLDQIWALGKEMLEANKDFLPQFAKQTSRLPWTS
jgi:alpha-galactosidase/6-phospho-beta-glucosidase family protein